MKEKNTTCVSAYNLPTLYTKFKLLDVLITDSNQLTDFVFQGGNKLSLKLAPMERLFVVY